MGEAQQSPSTDDPRSKLAAEIFPREWKRVASVSGKWASKKRQQLRQQAETEVKLRALRAAGASCATCDSFRKKHKPFVDSPWCAAESDFHGYVLAKPDGLCTTYRPKESANG